MTERLNERACLSYDPFCGDRDVDVKVHRDLFVTTRKPHSCSYCFSVEIPSGTRVRARTETDRGENKTMTFYFCTLCCEAMASVGTDDGEALEARAELAQRKSGAVP